LGQAGWRDELSIIRTDPFREPIPLGSSNETS
jgi:hypothetical protein